MLNSKIYKTENVKSRFLSGKKLLQKKLSTFIFTVMMFSVSANAQIVYTDVNPDSTMYCHVPFGSVTKSYNLDLNNDANNDFILTANVWCWGMGAEAEASARITPQVNNAFITTTLNTVKKLALGDTISSSQAWHDTTFQYLKKWHLQPSVPNPIITDTGEWDTVVDGYIGLQLINAGQTYYGWVRMDVTVNVSTASITIKDYAYNSIPNQPILAGQTTGTGIIENSFASSINLFPNPATNHVTIALGSNNKKVEVTIADITGKIIYKTFAFAAEKIEVNTKDFAAGIYVVQIQSADFIGTKKLIVEK
jgi:hypothetical protein